MTTTDNAADVQQKTPPAVEAVIAELENTVIQDHRSAEAEDTQTANDAQPPSPRPPIVYSRKELLNLSQSFLVKPPDEMPDFKSWFGSVVLASCNVSLHLIYLYLGSSTSNLSMLQRKKWRCPVAIVNQEREGVVTFITQSILMAHLTICRYRRDAEEGSS